MNIYNGSDTAYALIEMKIAKSVSKSLGVLAIGLIFMPLGIWMIKGGAVENRGEFSIYLGWFCTLLFGFRSFQIFLGFLFGEKRPLVISPTGLRDTRMFSGEISWNAISSISTKKLNGSSVTCLVVKNECLRSLKLFPIARILRMTNLLVGYNGIYISANELDISFKELQARIVKYASVHNPHIRIDL